MNEMAFYYYFDRAMARQAIGRVLNVGLGEGLLARILLDRRSVSAVVSLEIDQAVIDAYRVKFPASDPLESRHTIVRADAGALGPGILGQLGLYDCIYVDIIEAFEDRVYQSMRNFVLSVKNTPLLKPTGVLLIEYQGDVPVEREFRVHWIDQQLRKTVAREALGTNPGGRSQAVTYYSLP